ncbi:MAG: acyl-CoA dehydratase activase-related protein, partial [Candidatus Coproplasma sp.]
ESYNLDEHCSVNHYNCPVVAYYPELLKANNERLTDDNFVMPYIDLNEPKTATVALSKALAKFGVKKGEIKRAMAEGFKRFYGYKADVKKKAEYVLKTATEQGKQIIVLAGRPYHVDAEINHGINKLITSLGMAVLSEDCVFDMAETVTVNVLNQWTYHARLYRAAQFCAEHDNVNLVQLVSFGCGLDAITTDEVRAILEKNGKLYTQIKIDEINNLGVVKIRLRSMLAALEEGRRK